MITEDYVSRETAILLKEKGFHEPVRYEYHYYNEFPSFHRHLENFNGEEYEGLQSKWYSAPTIQTAMKWLRKVHNIIPIILTGENRHDGVIIYYWFRIDTIKNGRWKDSVYREDEIEYPTYEKACEAAIQYCLTNLI